ncbi:MAG TPA: dienelactone hydrolase family protein [Ilumatobacteraceae bacterium]|jgi:carboxymethylenebutenolidase|nr:dienelactone hydrolase family protein [Ilumatobacteraceae bacterium]
MTRLRASDGHELDAYEVHPDGASASIVIVQEIFGVNAHIRSVVDRYASFGYRAIAPALFDRGERGMELGYDDAGKTRGIELVMPIAFDAAMLDVAAAVDHVNDTGPVAVIGYCFGGSVAWIAACDLPIAAAVGYYGGQVYGMRDRNPKAPTLLHFGELDHGIPLDQVQAIAEAHPAVPVHVYEGADHGFNCDARPQYDARSAAIALGRTLEFLAANGVR